MRNLVIPFLILLTTACGEKSGRTELSEANVSSQSSPAAPPSGEPHLFTDDAGTTYLSWIEKNDSVNLFKFSKWNNSGWSEPSVIASGDNWFVNWADYPMIASNGKGDFIAHVLDKSGEGTYAYDVKVFMSADEGASWSEGFTLHEDGKQAEHGFVSLLPYDGNFFVAWLDGRNTVTEGMENMAAHEGHHGAMSLRAAIVDTNGTKVSEWELDNRTCDCCQTTAVMTTNGPVVVYRDRSDEEIRDIAVTRLIDKEWTKPEVVYTDNWKIQGCPVNGPRAAAAGNNMVIAWFAAPEGVQQVNVVFSGDGGATFGKPVRVDDGKPVGRVDVAILDAKSAVVSWMEGATVKAVRVYADGTKETPVVVGSSTESRSGGFPQMTKSGDQLIFAWTDDQEERVKVASLSL